MTPSWPNRRRRAPSIDSYVRPQQNRLRSSHPSEASFAGHGPWCRQRLGRAKLQVFVLHLNVVLHETELEAQIDWSKPAADVYNTIRAANPAPGAWTTVNGSELKVYDSAYVEGDGAFGEVISIDNSGVTVQGNGGRILIKRVRPAGGGKIPADEWAAGARINAGTKLGSKM